LNTKYSSIEKPLSKSIYHGDGHANIEVDLNFGHGVLKHRCPKSFDENQGNRMNKKYQESNEVMRLPRAVF
jgi:hypothetical protein